MVVVDAFQDAFGRVAGCVDELSRVFEGFRGWHGVLVVLLEEELVGVFQGAAECAERVVGG